MSKYTDVLVVLTGPSNEVVEVVGEVEGDIHGFVLQWEPKELGTGCWAIECPPPTVINFIPTVLVVHQKFLIRGVYCDKNGCRTLLQSR